VPILIKDMGSKIEGRDQQIGHCELIPVNTLAWR